MSNALGLAEQANGAALPPAPPPHKILIVEDEVLIALDIKGRLENSGYSVVPGIASLPCLERYTLDHFEIGEGGRKLLSTVHFGNVFDFFLGEPWLHSRQRKPVLLDQSLEVAPSEMNWMSKTEPAVGYRSTALAISIMRLISASN